MRITKEKTSALIIDFQERLFPAIFEHERLLKNVPILIEGLKTLGIPIYVTEQYVKGLGTTVAPIAATLEGIERVEKSSFSCCDEPRTMMNLTAEGNEFIIVAGIESHVCVLQTVIDLRQNGFYPVVVTDCISSRKESDKIMALERMRSVGAILTTYEAVLFELLRFSGTDTFRTISKLIK